MALAAALVLASAQALAGCVNRMEAGRSYSICLFDPKKEDIRLFWRGPAGQPLGSFAAVAASLKPGEKLVFGMNGGMYDVNDAPLGLYVERGVTLRRVNLRGGGGNFHLKPNGVFFLAAGRAGVMETGAFLNTVPSVDYATQSGPMLVLNGRIHPGIHAEGTSLKTRNGVGIDREGQAVFAISNEAVSFYEFASLFRDALHCDNALFLDGSISALYAPELNRDDFTLPMGPIVGVVVRGR